MVRLRKTKIVAWTVCWVVSTTQPAWSQSAEAPPEASAASRSMTLPEAIAYARAHQPLVRAGLARVAARMQEAKIPTAQWLPQVGLTGQIFGATANNTTAEYLTSDALPIPRIGGTSAAASATGRPYGSTLVGAGIAQEAFDFGRISAQRAAADALVDAQRRKHRLLSWT